MKCLQQLLKAFARKSFHGDPSSYSLERFWSVHPGKQCDVKRGTSYTYMYVTAARTPTNPPVVASRTVPTDANVLKTLPSRHCSGHSLAPRFRYGPGPNIAYHMGKSTVSNPFQDCLQRGRHRSDLGSAVINFNEASVFEPTYDNAYSRSSLFARAHLQEWRRCSRNGLAGRSDDELGYCKLSSTNASLLSNLSLRAYLPKRRFSSGRRLALKYGYLLGPIKTTNWETFPVSHSSPRTSLPKNRHYMYSEGKLAVRRTYGTGPRKSTNEDTLSMSNPSLRAYLQHLVEEHRHICQQITDEKSAADGKKQRRLRRRLTELIPVVEKMEEWTNRQTELKEIGELISGESSDKEMKDLALQEKQEYQELVDDLEKEILSLIIPADETDDNDIIMEFSAGVGGQEAMLFTADMFEMYERFAAYKNWDFQKLEYFTTDLGGLRHASVSLSGDGAYRLMKHEAGVHRVQRVPKTEKAGRIHTSTMAVAVLPQPTEIDLKLDPKDLRIETKKASGAGGQHVNTTDSAVRILHIPSGIVAESQQERSQLKNRNIALTLLQTKIYNAISEDRETTERSMRRSQVGTSGRSEKIRTYNFQQDRVTDHRISQSVFDVEGFLSGGEGLDDMISSLVNEEENDMVIRMLEEFMKSQKKT